MPAAKDTLLEVLNGYVNKGENGYTELTRNLDETLFTLIATGKTGEKRFTFAALIVQIFADTIIIEEDRNDKPLVDALLQAGISREKIILAYMGEEVLMPQHNQLDPKYLTILRLEMEKYSGEGLNCISHFIENLSDNVFVSVTLSLNDERTQPFMDLFVRVVADKIIIEVDQNDKPLVDALVYAGIPREKIILAYAGEKVPDTSA